jgi:hypothetical protein
MTSETDEVEWLDSRLGRFTFAEKNFVTHWLEGWVRLKGEQGTAEKR